MTRWSTLLLDEARLDDLPHVPVSEILRHREALATYRPSPADLYERWERQQWRAEDIPLEPDRDRFDQLSEGHRRYLTATIHTFIVGEYTGLDLLGPILAGAPAEADLLFLGTQVADEARHTRLMLRLGTDLLGLDLDTRRLLDEAWLAVTPAHRRLAALETRIVTDLQAHPGDYRRWLRAVTLFHLITEEVLAVAGQTAMIRLLKQLPGLPGLTTAFIAMTRDESRHVNYGIHTLREAVAAGYADEISETIEEAATLTVWIDAVAAPTRAQARHIQASAQLCARRLGRAMRRLDLPEPYVEHVTRRALAAEPQEAIR
ncbi:hypothetical protein AWW66_00545 [Micromonospora rosaria]|uniref:Uncharacterized protein n=1 Tax=Micromonospora rosaria TaxID=47874 RepID=A0A136Q0H4_9ACTN|nr:ribonucleotide-diphosphate reductase subunit beta [Micromonospora rosaria]KXK63966.1 hypothetical protein AWW66_00545 [Micromonospora rosaria]